jgi:hypothetical protein
MKHYETFISKLYEQHKYSSNGTHASTYNDIIAVLSRGSIEICHACGLARLIDILGTNRSTLREQLGVDDGTRAAHRVNAPQCVRIGRADVQQIQAIGERVNAKLGAAVAVVRLRDDAHVAARPYIARHILSHVVHATDGLLDDAAQAGVVWWNLPVLYSHAVVSREPPHQVAHEGIAGSYPAAAQYGQNQQTHRCPHS